MQNSIKMYCTASSRDNAVDPTGILQSPQISPTWHPRLMTEVTAADFKTIHYVATALSFDASYPLESDYLELSEYSLGDLFIKQ